MNKEKLMNKFIDKISQGVIFYKTPFMPSEINAIFSALRLKERLKKELDWFNKYNNIDSDWNAPSVRDLLQKILEDKK